MRAVAITIALMILPAFCRVARADDRPSVAILELEVFEASPATVKLGQEITEAMRSAARKPASPYRLAPGSERTLVEMKALGGCADESAACMAGIGQDLGADFLLYGRIQKVAGGFEISVALLDVKRKIEQTTTGALSAAEAAQAGTVRLRSRALYNRAAGVVESGALVVTADVETGSVAIDGEDVASLEGGSARIEKLPPGKHEVVITAEGRKPLTRTVAIEAGKSTELDVKLDLVAPDKPADKPADKPGRPGAGFRYAFFGALAVTVASGVGGLVEVARVRSIQDETVAVTDSLSMEDRAMLDPNDICAGVPAAPAFDALRSKCDEGRSAATLSNIFLTVTVVGVAASATLFYLGYIRDPSGEAKTDTATLVPLVAPGTAGAQVTWRF